MGRRVKPKIMALPNLIAVARSDGVSTYMLGGNKVPNEPDASQNQSKGARKYYWCDLDHYRSKLWRTKLGDMFIKAKGGPEHQGKSWVLENFPNGYTLWEDEKIDLELPVEGPGKVKTKDRSDAYLYGHPGGKAKRFRSPGEFLPHLIWLSGGDGDGPCECKQCKLAFKMPEKKVDESSQGKAEDKGTLEPEKQTTPGPQDSSADFVNMSITTLASDTRNLEQKFDAEPHGIFFYRPGELVWFNKGSAWALAIICKRQIMNSIPTYLLQPLSHPIKHLPPVIKDQELVRPWFAWSVPDTTHSQIAHLTYDQVPWAQVLKGEVGHGDPEVDGSILAAKRVDASYTLFDRITMLTASPGEVFYAGMFLGAEKIWVGEPLRCRTQNDDIVVIVLHHIIETTIGATSGVTLVGDIYKFVEMPTPFKSRSEWSTPDLPARMVVDLRFRNEVADNARRGVWHEWRLLEPMARKALTEVRGRWYETQALLPKLRGIEFQNEISRGVTSDAGRWMNGRGDSTNGAGERKGNRLDALGRSVPQDLKISRGLNGPPSENLFPTEQPNLHAVHGVNHESQYGPAVGMADAEMDHFMNLDHAGENQGWVQRGG